MTIMSRFVGYISDFVLDIHYWQTRITLVGISVSSVWIDAIFKILEYFFEVMVEPALFDRLGLAVLATVALLPAWSSLKAVMRLELVWKGATKIPAYRRHSASHKERASARLEARTTWLMKLTVCYILSNDVARLRADLIHRLDSGMPYCAVLV